MAFRLKNNVLVTMGAQHNGYQDRENGDYYATDPVALTNLLEVENNFSKRILEPACGGGHLSIALEERGFEVLSTDLVYRGYGVGGVDFLTDYKENSFDGDIITNPPYSLAQEFVEHGLKVVTDGHKVCYLLRILFLEGKRRRQLFDKTPPKYVYISTNRINCVRNGDFSKESRKQCSAQGYAWFLFEKGYQGETIVRWFN